MENVRNPRLYEAFKRCCTAGVGTLGQEIERVERVSKHHIVRKTPSILRLQSCQALLQVMEEDETVRRHLRNYVGSPWYLQAVRAETILESVLEELVRRQRTMESPEGAFDALYPEIEEYFYQDALPYTYLAPLANFKMEARGPIRLGGKLSIVRLPQRERHEILATSREFPLWYGSLPGQMAFVNYAIQLHAEMPKFIGAAPRAPARQPVVEAARGKIEDACSALRLFKGGVVGYDSILAKPMRWDLSTRPVIFRGSPPGGLWQPVLRVASAERYVLSRKEVPAFLEFWGLYQRARSAMQKAKAKNRRKDARRIEIALGRFSFGYERAELEDKLIDRVIGFEALLLFDRRQELAYPFALRGAALLAREPGERKKIFDQLKAAYTERGNVVHGGLLGDTVRVDDKHVSVEDFLSAVEAHLRSTIRAFLVFFDKGVSQQEVIGDLDGKVARGFEPQEER